MLKVRVMTKKPNPLPTYPNYPMDHPCHNNSRITKIETKVDHLEEHQEEFNKTLKEYQTSLNENTTAIKELSTIMKERKKQNENKRNWMDILIGIGMTVGAFILMEIIKMIT